MSAINYCLLIVTFDRIDVDGGKRRTMNEQTSKLLSFPPIFLLHEANLFLYRHSNQSLAEAAVSQPAKNGNSHRESEEKRRSESTEMKPKLDGIKKRRERESRNCGESLVYVF
jgi:hypothetical protein